MLDTDSGASPAPKMNETIYLSDYAAPDFAIISTELHFELNPDKTRVHARLQIENTAHSNVLVLHGEQLSLLSLQLDGVALTTDQYTYAEDKLTLAVPDQSFLLETVVEIEPEKNTQLSGLYQSSGNYCTQCEAEGFRRITFYLDRPDVLSVYTVTITADQKAYPVLLSNGNLQSTSTLPNGRHQAIWHDPHPKPSYLFALVAGQLSRVSDQFVTQSGQSVELNVYAEEHNIDKCDHALRSLIKSMQWDEQVYGREYDLDIYNIVAVDDFNMGAMENKGLNVFNSKYVLALPDTATDADFDNIESVIGHEYFHNWSGNRVTCRDWFQLSLKEGFTVFRDQEFSADMASRGVKRIQDVDVLRTYQFKEDAGPMAHPIRPDSYQEINNFYTVTVYNKGAEVVRMLHTLLGADAFRAGTDLYFERHDGAAVTTDDFVQALTDATGADLSQFQLWYSQAGTPVLTLTQSYADQVYTLTITQDCPDTPKQSDKQPFHLPLRVALLDEIGQVQLQETVLNMTERTQSFEFKGISNKPVLSFLRGFSAPVKVDFAQSEADRICLVQHDDDPFVRWEAMQRCLLDLLLQHYQADSTSVELTGPLQSVFESLLTQPATDKAMLAELLSLPSESYLADFCVPIDPPKLRRLREQLADQLAIKFAEHWLRLYQENLSDAYALTAEDVSKRRLRNRCLYYLLRLPQTDYTDLAAQQFQQADNMTDSIAALSAIVNAAGDSKLDKQHYLDQFYQRWQSNALVLDKWFSLQASVKNDDTFETVQRLCEHPQFSMTNPNKVRSLLGAFAQNGAVFHQEDGLTYQFYIDKVIELDSINPQVAARMVSALNQWKTYAEPFSSKMQQQLQRLQALPELSKDVREIVSKAL